MSADYLFPNRRTFLAASAGAAAGLTAAARAADEKPPTVGDGPARFAPVPGWGKLPDGMKYGHGCAVVVDAKDRVIVTSRSASPCVAIFDKEGKLLETWTKEFTDRVGLKGPQEFAATAHGLYWSQEPGGEFLYWTENVAGPKDGPKLGARVYKTDMQGKVLYTLGNVAEESSTSQKLPLTNPTDVAVAPNGDIYLVDGYGSQKLFRFDKNFKLLKTIGGRGKEHGQFSTCHGVWVSTLRKDPEVYIADRANNRIEVFSPELEYKRTIPGFSKPCCFYQHQGLIYVPELDSQISVVDADDKIVTRLGDGPKAAGSTKPRTGVFEVPHAVAVSSAGDLYCVEWVPTGRPQKLTKVKG